MSYRFNTATTDSLYPAGQAVEAEDNCAGALTRRAKTAASPVCQYNRDAPISRKPTAMSDEATGWGCGENDAQ